MKTHKRVVHGARPRKMEITGGLDRRAAEMLGLELAMLAKAHGLKVARVEIKALTRTARKPRPRAAGPSTGSDSTNGA